MSSADQRKLAAIMFTDMVGFSALSQRSESLALELLEEHRLMIRGIISRFEGREVKTTGDGFLLEFPSALSAVRAALAIQRAFYERNQSSPANRQVRIRIGIHVGDVVARDGDIHGDGVNLAARLEPLAPAGGICVSNAVYEQVRNKVDESFVNLGPAELKNIVLPVTVHRAVLPWEERGIGTAKPYRGLRAATLLMVGGGLIAALGFGWWKIARPQPTAVAPAPSIPAALEPARDEKSIAVLAFANLSEDKANEYFSDGLSEELLNVLAKIPGLKVSARTSAFHFKGKDTPIPEIARQLGVAYVVEGSVRKSGNEVRITAQLIKASDGFHVWSDTFTREAKNVFAVQDEIAGLIAKSLQLQFGPGKNTNLGAVNPEVVRLYLEGRREWNIRSGDSVARARGLFEQALAIDPNFARARAGLADALYIQGGQFFGEEYDGLAKQAEIEAQAALKLEPNLSEAYATLGIISWRNRQYEKSDALLKLSAKLNPNYPSAHQWYGRTLFQLGEADESIAELKRAAQLDPLAPVIRANLALIYGGLRQPRRALAAADEALAIQPGFFNAKGMRAYALMDLGRNDEAAKELRALLELPPGSMPGSANRYTISRGYWSSALATTEGPAAMAQQIEKVRKEYPNRYDLQAPLLAKLGRFEEALVALQGASAANQMNLSEYLSKEWDPVRTDPRVLALVERSGYLNSYRKLWAYISTHPDGDPSK